MKTTEKSPPKGVLSLLRVMKGNYSGRSACAMNPDGTRIVSTLEGNELKVWDSEKGMELCTLTGHFLKAQNCTYSPNGARIVSASGDKTLKVWNAKSGMALRTLAGHSAWVFGCMYSPDGTKIVSASGDTTLKVWDSESGVALCTLTGHSLAVRDCAYSPDGTKIVSASMDNTLKVWNAGSGVELCTLTGHSNGVRRCAYSPDGTRIISASYDHTLKIWDVKRGVELCTLTGHLKSVLDCAYSPDGTKIISVSRTSVRMWDAKDGCCLAAYDAYDDDAAAQLFGCSWVSENNTIVVFGSKAVYFLEFMGVQKRDHGRPFLKTIILTNVRCFKTLTLSFVDAKGQPRPWTLILGDNGQGKSTVLRAIALLTAGSGGMAELLDSPDEWVADDQDIATIQANLLLPDGTDTTVRLDIQRGKKPHEIIRDHAQALLTIDRLSKYYFGAFLTFGYGVTRRPSWEERSAGGRITSLYREPRAQAVATLFSSDERLYPLPKMVIDMDYRQHPAIKTVSEVLNLLLPDYLFQRIDRNRMELLFTEVKSSSTARTLGQLSDGYQSMAAWAGDLLYRISQVFPEAEDLRTIYGLLMIDEADLHLHPLWQKKLRRFLREAFPNMQFVITSHSPFLVQSLEDGELLKLPQQAQAKYAHQSIEDIAEAVMGVENVTWSEKRIRMLETAKEYYQLLEQAKKAEPEQLKRLKEQLDLLSARFLDDPAYCAYLEFKREASL